MLKHVTVIALVGLAACSKKPAALDVCKKLETASVARNCKLNSERGGLVATAKEKAVFDLVAPADKTGQVLTFGSEGDLDATVKAFQAAAVLAGRHRYASTSALVFVQLNSDATEAEGSAAKGVVDGL